MNAYIQFHNDRAMPNLLHTETDINNIDKE